MNSILTKKQTKIFTVKNQLLDRENVDIIVNIRYDDECNNGHNTFSITGDVYKAGKAHTDRNFIMGGCIHDIIEKYFPSLRKYIKWHLTSSDGPMYYIANTVYLAGDKDSRSEERSCRERV